MIDKKTRLSFHGAVEGVTGSCILLEVGESKLLIDCGMFQGERLAHDCNFADFNFDAAAIQAVFVTHAHYDHTGRLPILFKRGFTGRVFMTAATKELTSIILEDAAHVMAENARRDGDKILFSPSDVATLESNIKTVNYHTRLSPVPGVEVTFFNAGHILGSSWIEVRLSGAYTQSGSEKILIFSGDLGNQHIPILP